MWTRKPRPRQEDAPPAAGDLEGWLQDLTGGETTVRRLRKRLDAERDVPAGEDACPSCAGSSRQPGHGPAARSEEPVNA